MYAECGCKIVELTHSYTVWLHAYAYVRPLLEWVSEDAARAYPTPDSGLTYLIHAQIA